MKKPHLFSRILPLLCVIFLYASLGAQPVVTTQILVPQPVPVSVPQLLGRTGEPVLLLTNTHPFQKLKVMIGATIHGDNGITGSVDPRNKKPAIPIILQPGQPLALTGDQIVNIFFNYSIFDIQYSGIDLANIAQNPLFPEGKYVVCVAVFDYNTGQLLSAPAPANCSPPILVRTPDPPVIINPRNRSKLRKSVWDNILFQWTPVTAPGTVFQYDIRMVRVPRGVNPYDAIESQNFLWWEDKMQPAPLYLYDVSKPQLENATTYAWRVTAYDPTGQVAVKNDGHSDVAVFYFQEKKPTAPKLLTPSHRMEMPYSDHILFDWLDAQNAGTLPLDYTLRIAEVPTGMSYEAALQNTSLIRIEETGLSVSSYRYSSNSNLLQPDKQYVAQVQVASDNSEAEFENDGYSQIHAFSIKSESLPPPIITAPLHNGVVTLSDPMQYTFEWDAPVSQSGIPITYQLSIAEWLPGVPPDEVFGQADLLVYEATDIAGNQMVYDSTMPPLGVGRSFAVQVKAIADNPFIQFENDGKSNGVGFFVVPPLSDPNETTEFLCGTGCTPPQPEVTTRIDNLLPGDVISVGHFNMTALSISKNSQGLFNGIGIIQPTTFFPVPLSVNFSSLEVNTRKEVLDGIVQMVYAPNAPRLSEAEIREITSIRDRRDFFNYMINNAAKLAEAVNTIAAPMQFGAGENRIIILDGRFTTDGAFFDLIAWKTTNLDSDDPEQVAIFGVKNVCFSPGGIGIGTEGVQLELLNTVSISPQEGLTLVLNGSNPEGENTSRQAFANKPVTAASIDCDGLTNIHLEGLVLIPNDVAVPIFNGRVMANKRTGGYFWADIQDFDDFYVAVEFPENPLLVEEGVLTRDFYLKKLKDYSFHVATGIMDLSDERSPDMPVNAINSGDLWQGIYISDYTVTIPNWIYESGPNRSATVQIPEASGRYLVVGSEGTSFHTRGENLIPRTEAGKLGGWHVSIDAFNLKMTTDEIETMTFDGEIKPPISQDFVPFRLEGDWQEGQLDYDLRIDVQNADSMRIPMWHCKFVPGNSSFIDLAFSGEGYLNTELEFDDTDPEFSFLLTYGTDVDVQLDAHLNGKLYLNKTIGEIKRIDIRGLDVEGLRFSSDPPSLSVRRITFGASAPGALGIDWGIDPTLNVTVDSLGANRYRLRVGGLARVGGPVFGLMGKTGIELTGRLAPSGEWVNEDVHLKDIVLHGSAAILFLDARLQPFFNHHLYGNGYGGTVDLSIFNNMEGFNPMRYPILESRFGVTKNNNNQDINYFFIKSLDNPGTEQIPLELGTPLFGLYKGSFAVYYNLDRQRLEEAYEYIPDRNNRKQAGLFGNLLAGLITRPLTGVNIPSIFNCEVDARVNLSGSGGLQNISLRGSSYIMRQPPQLATATPGLGSEGMIRLDGEFIYNHSLRDFSGSLAYQINIPGLSGIGSSQEIVDLHIGNQGYYINVGTPAQPLSLPFSESFNLLGRRINLGLDVGMYFCVGKDNPALGNWPPPLPAAVRQACRSCSNYNSENINVSQGSGFAVGFHTAFDPPQMNGTVNLGWFGRHGFWLDIGAYAGFDLGFIKQNRVTCNNLSDYGINQWYGQGRGYVHGSFRTGLTVFGEHYTLAGVTLGAVSQLGFPNPTGLKGTVYANLEIGPFDISLNEGFTLGEQCVFDSETVTESDLISEITGLKLINDFNFSEGQIVSFTTFDPEVRMYFKPEQVYRVELGDRHLQYRLKIEATLKRLSGSNQLVTHLDKVVDRDGRRFYFNVNFPQEILQPDSEYEMRATAYLEVYDNGSWGKLEDDEGTAIEEVMVRSFVTEEAPNTIENPSMQLPLEDQLYFHQDDHNSGIIIADGYRLTSNWDLQHYKIVVRFVRTSTNAAITVDAQAHEDPGQTVFTFPIPQLSNLTRYKLELLVVSRHANNNYRHEIYSYRFSTSTYGRMVDKINALQIPPADIEPHGYIIGRCRQTEAIDDYGLTFQGREPFEKYEYERMTFLLDAGRSKNASNDGRRWVNYRETVENLALRNNTRNYHPTTEFIDSPNGTLVFHPPLHFPIIPIYNSPADVLRIRWRPDRALFYTKQAIKCNTNITLNPSERMIVNGTLRIMPKNTMYIKILYRLPGDDADLFMRSMRLDLGAIQ